MSGDSKKTLARLYAVQALFQMEASDDSADKVITEFIETRFGAVIDEAQYKDGDKRLFRQILETVIEQQARIDQATDRALIAKWPIDRIDPTLRALFRAAGGEIVMGKAPPKVVISQYLDVANAFSIEDQEIKFVNAVLDHIAREARPEEF